MSSTANQIAEWLFSNDPTLIAKAFQIYTPKLEQAVKDAFQARSSDLKDINFAGLPVNHILIDDLVIRDDLYKVVDVQIGGVALQDVYLVQPQVSTVEFDFKIDEMPIQSMMALLSCLKGNCWLSDVFKEKFGAEGDFYDISAFYYDHNTQTVHRLATTGLRGNLRGYDDVCIFSENFRQACEKSCIYIDGVDGMIIGNVSIPVLYFVCMKAGVSYSQVAPYTLPFNPADPIEIQYADKNITWKIAQSNLILDLSPFY